MNGVFRRGEEVPRNGLGVCQVKVGGEGIAGESEGSTATACRPGDRRLVRKIPFRRHAYNVTAPENSAEDGCHAIRPRSGRPVVMVSR